MKKLLKCNQDYTFTITKKKYKKPNKNIKRGTNAKDVYVMLQKTVLVF